MLGRQVAGKTDYPGQAAGAIFSLNLTFKAINTRLRHVLNDGVKIMF